MITAHTDVVGSLLRPVALRKARDDWVAGRLSHAQFKSIEDRAVDEAVFLQEAAGLDIVTDGEMRRLSFQSQMTEAVDGFGAWDVNAFLWGDWHGDAAVGGSRPERRGKSGLTKKPRPKPPSCGRGVLLSPRPREPRRKGHPPQPQPVCEFLVA